MAPLFGLVTASIACGPIQSSTILVDAAAEVAAAKTAKAAQHAPFEFAAAEEYLHKAREEQSYADYEVAVIFGKKSRDCARVARMKAEAAAAEEMGATRPTVKTRARCRPGPSRLVEIPDADMEPMAQPELPVPAAPNAVKMKKPPKAPAKNKRPAKPITPDEPEDPALPDGEPGDPEDDGDEAEEDGP